MNTKIKYFLIYNWDHIFTAGDDEDFQVEHDFPYVCLLVERYDEIYNMETSYVVGEWVWCIDKNDIIFCDGEDFKI